MANDRERLEGFGKLCGAVADAVPDGLFVVVVVVYVLYELLLR